MRTTLAVVMAAFLMGAATPVPSGSAAAPSPDMARQLVKAANERGPIYRAEAGQKLEAMGDVAVPALIEAKGPESPPDVRRWAVAVLETMNKKIPGEAVQTKDNDLLAQVLLAYGKTHDLDAVGVVFAFANVDRTNVRDAAREAIRLYGDGAISKLRETYTNQTNKAPDPNWNAAQLAGELFKVMDRSRLREVYKLFDDALATAKAAGDDGAKLQEAIPLLDQVLARQPLLDRRAEAAPIYARYARSLEESDAPRSLAYFRKAERLDPSGPEKDSIASSVTYLEAKDLEAKGVLDVEAFRRASTLDPTNEKARAALARLETKDVAKKSTMRVYVVAAAALLVLVSCAILFVRRRRD